MLNQYYGVYNIVCMLTIKEGNVPLKYEGLKKESWRVKLGFTVNAPDEKKAVINLASYIEVGEMEKAYNFFIGNDWGKFEVLNAQRGDKNVLSSYQHSYEALYEYLNSDISLQGIYRLQRFFQSARQIEVSNVEMVHNEGLEVQSDKLNNVLVVISPYLQMKNKISAISSDSLVDQHTRVVESLREDIRRSCSAANIKDGNIYPNITNESLKNHLTVMQEKEGFVERYMDGQGKVSQAKAGENKSQHISYLFS